MPVTSRAMWKKIWAMRNKYGSNAKTPKKDKWIWEDDWFKGVKFDSLPDKVQESIESIQDYQNQFGNSLVKKSFDSNAELPLLKNKKPKDKGLVRTIDVPSITVGISEDDEKFSFAKETKFELYELISENPSNYKLISLARDADEAFAIAKENNKNPITIVYRKSKTLKYPKFFVINKKIYRLPDLITYSFGHNL